MPYIRTGITIIYWWMYSVPDIITSDRRVLSAGGTLIGREKLSMVL
jgi:hypothetical protein